MQGRPTPTAWLLIVAAGVGAMVSGHAIALFAGAAASYSHTMQGPMLEAALLLALLSAFNAIRRIVAAAHVRRAEADWALPAFASIARFGVAPSICAVIGVQIAALVLGESIEQHAAGLALTGGLALLGAASPIVPFVHAAVGAIFAIVLWSTSRAICTHVAAAVSFVRRAITWLSRTTDTAIRSAVAAVAPAAPRTSLLIANKIGSRPPPVFASIV